LEKNPLAKKEKRSYSEKAREKVSSQVTTSSSQKESWLKKLSIH
jgi:hypothetical protein